LENRPGKTVTRNMFIIKFVWDINQWISVVLSFYYWQYFVFDSIKCFLWHVCDTLQATVCSYPFLRNMIYLSHSCTLLKPFDGFRCHLWGPMTHYVRWRSLTPNGKRTFGGQTPSQNLHLLTSGQHRSAVLHFSELFQLLVVILLLVFDMRDCNMVKRATLFHTGAGGRVVMVLWRRCSDVTLVWCRS